MNASENSPLPLVQELVARFSWVRPRTVVSADGMPSLDVPATHLVAFAVALRDEWRFDLLTDMAGCDWGVEMAPEARFGVVYHFARSNGGSMLRVACLAEPGGEGEAVALPSLSDVFASANWFEREIFDLFGVAFDGHPDLRRILMWEGYEWHPLRKDFPLAGREAALPPGDADNGAGLERVAVVPMEGGPFASVDGGGSLRKGEPRAGDQSWADDRGAEGNRGDHV